MERLIDAIERILSDYPTLIVEELFNSDSVRIRGRRPGMDFRANDIVGEYFDDAWDDGKVTEAKIREGIEKCLRARNS